MVRVPESSRKTQGKVRWYQSRNTEQVRRQLEAKLVLGDFGFFDTAEDKMPKFDAFADLWMKDYARVECKPRPQMVTREFFDNILDHDSVPNT